MHMCLVCISYTVKPSHHVTVAGFMAVAKSEQLNISNLLTRELAFQPILVYHLRMALISE